MFMLILIFIIVMVVVMLVLVLIIVVMVMMATFMFILIIVMMVVAATFVIIVVIVMVSTVNNRSILCNSLVASMMMVMMVMLFLFHYLLKKLCLKVIITFKSIKDFFTCDLIKRSCDNSSLVIMLADKLYSFLYLLLISLVCSGKNNSTCILNLINKELTKVLDINLSLGNINYCNSAVELHF